MPHREDFSAAIGKHGIDEQTARDILNVTYAKSDSPCQDNANFYCAAMRKCDALLARDAVMGLMSSLACCTDGEMLEKTKAFAKKYASKPFAKKIKKLKHVSQPWIIDENHIGAYITGEHETRCSCWCFDGCKPENDTMPMSYCYCCAGFMKFHYENALGIQLKIAEMPSSFLHTGERCSVIFKIL